MEIQAAIVLIALLIDALVGDPAWLWRAYHPITWFGRAIALATKLGNNLDLSPIIRRINGFIVLVILVSMAAMIGWGLSTLCQRMGNIGIIIQAVIGSIFLAQRSLSVHVKAVGIAFTLKGLKQARLEIAKIVGRNPDELDEVGICRGAIESLSENSSDGVIAPAFWFLILGLPGLLAYKMVNTADSMIGHKNEHFMEFGAFSARIDDVVNYLPARLTTFLVIIATLGQLGPKAARRALHVALQDGPKHNSPNAGWPESAYAGALNISLAGPRSYGTKQVEAAFQNRDGAPPTPHDIARALSLFWRSLMLFYLILAGFILTLTLNPSPYIIWLIGMISRG